MLTQACLIARVKAELLPLSKYCADDVLYDILLGCDALHMRIMTEVIDEYVTALRSGITIDGYRRDDNVKH